MIAALIVSVAITTSSQGPAPRPTKVTQEQQNKSAPEQRKSSADQKATNPTPPAVDHSAAVVATWNQQYLGNQRKNEAPVDWWSRAIVLFTGALAWLAWRQWRAMQRQADFMRDTLKETKIAREVETRHLHAVEGADVLVESIEIVTDGQRETKLSLDSRVVITVRNYGRTRANDLMGTCKLKYRPHSPGDGTPIQTLYWDARTSLSVLAPNQTDDAVFDPLSTRLDSETIYNLNNPTPQNFPLLQADCAIEFWDVFGERRTAEARGTYWHSQGRIRWGVLEDRVYDKQRGWISPRTVRDVPDDPDRG